MNVNLNQIANKHQNIAYLTIAGVTTQNKKKIEIQFLAQHKINAQVRKFIQKIKTKRQT